MKLCKVCGTLGFIGDTCINGHERSTIDKYHTSYEELEQLSKKLNIKLTNLIWLLDNNAGEKQVNEVEHVWGMCTCNYTNFESHYCPFKTEIHQDESECQCCPHCMYNCAQEI